MEQTNYQRTIQELTEKLGSNSFDHHSVIDTLEKLKMRIDCEVNECCETREKLKNTVVQLDTASTKLSDSESSYRIEVC